MMFAHATTAIGVSISPSKGAEIVWLSYEATSSSICVTSSCGIVGSYRTATAPCSSECTRFPFSSGPPYVPQSAGAPAWEPDTGGLMS
jgi:hypothetical protein